DPNFSLPANFYGFNRYSNVAKTDKPQLYDPGLGFANKMAALRPSGNRIGLVFNARGATTVADWQQGAAAPSTASWPSGDLFSRTIDRV
ncbi:sialate O-acetylesterase, partial [Acinetobacter baumannii]